MTISHSKQAHCAQKIVCAAQNSPSLFLDFSMFKNSKAALLFAAFLPPHSPMFAPCGLSFMHNRRGFHRLFLRFLDCPQRIGSLAFSAEKVKAAAACHRHAPAAFRIYLRLKSKNSDHPDGCSEFLVGEGGFEPPKSLTTDLQSAPFGHSGIPPYSVCCAAGRLELVDGLEPPTC